MSTMTKTAVIGSPIKHSLSPTIHNHWFVENKMNDYTYEKLEVELDNFSEAIDNFNKQGYLGLNVTVPLKEAAHEKPDTLSENATQTKAVNTLLFKDGKIFGDNTDPVGFTKSLPQKVIDKKINSKNCLLLGAGGSSRAVLWSLSQLNANIAIYNRTEDKAVNLLKTVGAKGKILKKDELDDYVSTSSFIVNTTSLGLQEGEVNDLVNFENVRSDTYIYDLIYNPSSSSFLDQAKNKKLKTQNGLRMLVEQAAASFEIWHGVSPAVDEKLLEKLGA